MDPITSRSVPRTDMSIDDTRSRPTPVDGPAFKTIIARSATSLATQAQGAVTQLPGGPVLAAALRGANGAHVVTPTGGATGSTSAAVTTGAPAATASAEGPGVTDPSGTSIEGTLQSSQDMNLYYLQLQEQMAAENRQYTACSNVLKERHDTVKNAIGNIR